MDEKLPLRYRNSDIEVRLGDHVQTRIFFRKRVGRVVYVPGISMPNPEFERDGLSEVGIRLADGSMLASVVDPITWNLCRKEAFLKRDASGFEEIQPDDRPFEDGEQGVSP